MAHPFRIQRTKTWAFHLDARVVPHARQNDNHTRKSHTQSNVARATHMQPVFRALPTQRGKSQKKRVQKLLIPDTSVSHRTHGFRISVPTQKAERDQKPHRKTGKRTSTHRSERVNGSGSDVRYYSDETGTMQQAENCPMHSAEGVRVCVDFNARGSALDLPLGSTRAFPPTALPSHFATVGLLHCGKVERRGRSWYSPRYVSAGRQKETVTSSKLLFRVLFSGDGTFSFEHLTPRFGIYTLRHVPANPRTARNGVSTH